MKVIMEKRVLLSIIFVLILCVLGLIVSRFTYAYLFPVVSSVQNSVGEVTAGGDILYFSADNNLTFATANTSNFNSTSGNITGSIHPSVRFVANPASGTANANYYVGVEINTNSFVYSTNDSTKPELLLTILDENNNPVTTAVDSRLVYKTASNGTGVSGFDITGLTGTFAIAGPKSISTASTTLGTTHSWTATITFVNLATDQSLNENSSLALNMLIQRDAITNGS